MIEPSIHVVDEASFPPDCDTANWLIVILATGRFVSPAPDCRRLTSLDFPWENSS